MTTQYYKLKPDQIVEDIMQTDSPQKIHIKGLDFFVFPHVYPSNQFRSSKFILDEIESMVENRTVCDMGCGMGVIGQFALCRGARKVIQADINPYAVKNALANKELHRFDDNQLEIYQSDCFDQIPHQKFDLIIFNIPFHSEPFTFSDPLERAFHDPGFQTLKKFVKQAATFCQRNGEILIVFSNKGDIAEVEQIFKCSQFQWELWRLANTDQIYDTRIYRLHLDQI